MTDNEEETLMREIVKSAAGIYAGMNIEDVIRYTFRCDEIPVLRSSERIRVVLIREHDEPQPVMYPVEVDKELSVVFEVNNLDFKPKEKKELTFTHKAYDFVIPKISDFSVESLFSVDKGVITVTNNKNKKVTLDKLQVYGRKYYTSTETFAGVTGYVEGVAA